MSPTELEKQKRAIAVFEELHKEIPKIDEAVSVLGWKQRNELIDHVYSDYNNHENLIKARAKWKRMLIQYNALKWLYKILQENRDLYGYFENYELIILKIEEIIDEAIRQESYEIVSTLKPWFKKLVTLEN